MKYETNKYICDFQQFETIRSFADSTFNLLINKSGLKKDPIFTENELNSSPSTEAAVLQPL